MAKRRPPKAVIPVLIWDTVWKLLAVRRAIQLRKFGWIPILLGTSSVGIVPILFLLKNRAPEPEAAEA